MAEPEHQPRVDTMTDEPQTDGMQPTDADGAASLEQPQTDDGAGGPDVDEKTHEVRKDIAETPPAG